jgi:YYY domain-containing protein
MLELFQMWALIEIMGLIALPLTVTVFHNLPDRGWAFSKTMGVVVFTFCVWLPLVWLQFLPYSRAFIIGVGLLLLICGLAAWWRSRAAIIKAVRLNKAYIVVAELVFLGMVFLLGWLRLFNPNINSFEMFMDEGFIAAIMRSPHLPPNDMWFSGYSINYYYYAHFTAATLGKLLGQVPSVVFNTGICMFFGLTAINLFGVSSNVVAWARYLRTRTGEQQEVAQNGAQEGAIEQPDLVMPSLQRAIPYGLLAIAMGLIFGNLAATQQWWVEHGEPAHFDWFAPSRVIPNTINEFPAFSFLLSCFHAHVLTMAFDIAAIGLAFNLLLEDDGKGFQAFGRGWRIPCTLIITALMIGGLFLMNGWDYPTYMGLALVCIGIQQWCAYRGHVSRSFLLDLGVPAAVLVVLSFLLFAPFYLNFVSPAQGLGLVAPQYRTQLRDEMLIYGLFAFVFISLLITSALKRPLLVSERSEQDEEVSNQMVRLIWLGALFVLDLTFLLLLPNSLTFVVFGSGAYLGVLLFFYHINDRAHAFTLFLGALAFALVAGCEILFLKDVFADTVDLRMNTVFKFYFQCWSLLAISSSCGVFFIIESLRASNLQEKSARWWRWGVQGLWGGCMALLVLASMVYPVFAPATRLTYLNPLTPGYYLAHAASLDGMTYLQSYQELIPVDNGQKSVLYSTAGDYAAIRWINAHIQGDPVIVESVGDDYSWWGRISAFTGLPTLMGWAGHEVQWRVNWLGRVGQPDALTQRIQDVNTIYTDPDPNTVLATMARYHAQYLYVGALESIKYPGFNLRRFRSFMNVVYDKDGVTIYQVRS